MSPSFPSTVYVINNTDCAIQCKANSSKMNLDKLTRSFIVVNVPNKRLSVLDKIKNTLKRHVVKITWYNKSTDITLKPFLKKGIFDLRFSKYVKDICVKVRYIVNRENSKYYDVIIKIENNNQAENENPISQSRQSSYTDLSLHSSFKSQSSINEMCYPEKQKRYSKKYYPINQEQATYMDSRSARISRSSVTSVNENQIL